MRITTLAVVAAVLSVITIFGPAPALAGENDGPVKNGLTAYQLAPSEAGTLVFEFWLHDESVVNIGNYDLMVNIDGVATDIRIATVQGYDTCTELAQRYRATVLVHPGQIRVSDITITGRKPYYVDRSVNLNFRIEGGQTQTVRQAVAESLLVTLKGYGKVRVGDKIMIDKAPLACVGYRSFGGHGGHYLELADPYLVQRDPGLCSSVSVETAPSRSASGNHIWVYPGEQVTILLPEETVCERNGYYFDSRSVRVTQPCEVKWHGPAVAGHQHNLSCDSDEHVVCETAGTGELVSQPECRVVSDQPVEDEDAAIAYRVTAGNESRGVPGGYAFTANSDTTVAQITDD